MNQHMLRRNGKPVRGSFTKNQTRIAVGMDDDLFIRVLVCARKSNRSVSGFIAETLAAKCRPMRKGT